MRPHSVPPKGGGVAGGGRGLRPLLAIALLLCINIRSEGSLTSSSFPPIVREDSLDKTSIAKKEPAPLLDGCGASVTANKGNGTGTNTNEQYCSDAHRRAVEFCAAPGANAVPMREGVRQVRIKSWGTVRPYSLSPVLESAPLPRCESLDEYLSAIRLGSRTWPDSERMDRKQSIFVPNGCYVPSLPPRPLRACQILDQYDHVIFHGDSLTRHLRQAIYMTLRGDYVKGGLVTNDTTVNEKCICDGQFSESKTCRRFDPYFNSMISPREVPGDGQEMCPDAAFVLGKRDTQPYLTRKGKDDPGESIDWGRVDCADAKYKGILIVLQGGLHWAMNATDTFDSFVQPVLSHPKYQQCACLGKVRLVWTGMSAQSRALDESGYSHQSRENATIFNNNITKAFVAAGLTPGTDVTILDWLNFTADAQSSDGLHFLTDVNVGKAAQILYLAERWPFPPPSSTRDERCLRIRDSRLDKHMPRQQFTNGRGDSIVIPEGAPLPPAEFFEKQGWRSKRS